MQKPGQRMINLLTVGEKENAAWYVCGALEGIK
jgi:hypothetical protein